MRDADVGDEEGGVVGEGEGVGQLYFEVGGAHGVGGPVPGVNIDLL